jgi:hypothetical protein
MQKIGLIWSINELREKKRKSLKEARYDGDDEK